MKTKWNKKKNILLHTKLDVIRSLCDYTLSHIQLFMRRKFVFKNVFIVSVYQCMRNANKDRTDPMSEQSDERQCEEWKTKKKKYRENEL